MDAPLRSSVHGVLFDCNVHYCRSVLSHSGQATYYGNGEDAR